MRAWLSSTYVDEGVGISQHLACLWLAARDQHMLTGPCFDIPHAAGLLSEPPSAVSDPRERYWWRLARVPHTSLPHSCSLPCSPAHRGIGLGVLSCARADVLDIFPVLVILGLQCRDTVLIPGDP